MLLYTLAPPDSNKYAFLPLTNHRLKLVHLLLAVSQLGQYPSQLSLVLRTLLAATDSLVQSRRPANKDLDVLLLWLRQHSLQQILGDVSATMRPALGRVVQEVEGTEAARVRVLELLEFLLEDNVFLAEIAVDQGDFCLVVFVLEDVAYDLVHRRDACSTGDQGNVLVLVFA